jgi:dihydrofolate synthase / folylpolyglutamate synthase
MMNFEESVKYLLSLGNEVLTMKLGLENIRMLLEALGNPHKKYLKVQIAGTNGKGSTCAFLESICLQAGLKVGLNISPHLVSITERIRINGKEISREEFARQVSIIKKTSEELVGKNKLGTLPTFFEQITAVALKSFADAGVEVAILETGLGGRFDAVTAAQAEIVALTPIDFDHQKVLGDTIEKIAAEKAAIIRPDTQVVCSNQHPEALGVILKRLDECGVSPIMASEVMTFTTNDGLCFQTTKAKYESVKLGLLGEHQIENAKVAILLAEVLQERIRRDLASHIPQGLAKVQHKGRLEFIGRFLFDGAHNVAGAECLRRFIQTSIKQPLTLIFGVTRDKEIEKIGEILFPQASFLILTRFENQRSMELEKMWEVACRFLPQDKIFKAECVGEAISKALEVSSASHLILVTGSLYLIGQAQKILQESKQARAIVASEEYC